MEHLLDLRRRFPRQLKNDLINTIVDFCETNKADFKSIFPKLSNEKFEDMVFTKANNMIKSLEEEFVMSGLRYVNLLEKYDYSMKIIDVKAKGENLFSEDRENADTADILNTVLKIRGYFSNQSSWALSKAISDLLADIPVDLHGYLTSQENGEMTIVKRIETACNGIYDLELKIKIHTPTKTLLDPSLMVDDPKRVSTGIPHSSENK